jgi:hypothetical protein
MPIPTKEEQEKVLNDRPGDALYPKAKDDIAKVATNSEKLKKSLVALVLDDMSQDLAVSDALNHVSLVLNYLPQDQEMDIESPEFSGDKLMTDFSRIAKLKLSLDYAKLLKLDENALDAVLKAEIGRLWGDPNSSLLKRLLQEKTIKSKAEAPAHPPVYKNKKNKG